MIALNKEKRMKLYRTLFKILISIIILYGIYLIWAVVAFGGGCKSMQSESHYLPMDYIGVVYILFNDKMGLAREKNNSTRLYRIPNSGILRTKYSNNYGWTNFHENIKFYYVYGDSLIRLPTLRVYSDSVRNVDSNQIVIYEFGYISGWEHLNGKEQTILTYMIDSFKNSHLRHDYHLSKENYKNWIK